MAQRKSPTETTALTPRFTLEQLPSARPDHSDGLADLIEGLDRKPIELPPRLLYDARGSALFEAITRLAAYYPTRAELQILESHAADILGWVEPDELLELGSGSSRKTRLLIEAGLERGCRRYRPVDVSESALREAGEALTVDYPELRVEGLVGDFAAGLHAGPRRGRRMVLFLGSTLGNLHPAERAQFLGQLARSLRPNDALLLGYDLVKSAAALNHAYDDPAGVTAAFVRNGLFALGRLGGARLPLAGFAYEAVWVPELQRVEMRLVARRNLAINLPRLDRALRLVEGEYLIAEISTKFTRAGLAEELRAAGLEPERTLTDAGRRFELVLARPVGPAQA